MKYITVYGNLLGRRIVSEDTVYWLSQKSDFQGKGFFLLEKEWNGVYTILRVLMTDKEFGEQRGENASTPSTTPNSKIS